jgi:hypothetical protein
VNFYIKLGRGENVTLDQLTSDIKTASIPWITELSGQLIINATEILRAIVYWIFAEFINPLIAAFFYVTEGEGMGSQLLYYRKPVWSALMRLGKKQLNLSFNMVIAILIVYKVLKPILLRGFFDFLSIC